VVGREGETCSVRLQLPWSWRAWVALPFEDGAYVAQDYDELADSPFECGTEASHAVHTFTARGVRHELVVWGRGDFDGLRVVADLIKIIDAEAGIFGDFHTRTAISSSSTSTTRAAAVSSTGAAAP